MERLRERIKQELPKLEITYNGRYSNEPYVKVPMALMDELRQLLEPKQVKEKQYEELPGHTFKLCPNCSSATRNDPYTPTRFCKFCGQALKFE